MDLLAKMTTFVRVVESGSFAAAAKQLRISSAAVSRQIATLEDGLRTPLLTRTTRSMVLTPAGQRYYERCVRLLREVEDAQQLGRYDAADGLLRVSAPVTFGLACVAPHMRSLMKKNPGLLVELYLDDHPVDLTLEGFDVAIRVGGEAPPSTEIVAKPLMRYERGLFAAPSYLRKKGAPQTPEALAGHDALMHLMGPTDTWTFFNEREARVRPNVVFRSNALHVLRELAIDGAGLALLPVWFAQEALGAGKLKRVLLAWRSREVVANAIYRKEQRGAARVGALVEHLRQEFQQPRSEESRVDPVGR